MIDAPDVRALAEFYSRLRGWPIDSIDENDAALDLGEGVAYLAIQRNDNYIRPTWPADDGTQQMMLHLDFEVDDLAAETRRAIALGAQLPPHQPQDDVRVLLDPAGHPFCLYAATDPRE